MSRVEFVYMYPNFGELTQFLNISREPSVVVQNWAELQLAFSKIMLVKRMFARFGFARLVNTL